MDTVTSTEQLADLKVGTKITDANGARWTIRKSKSTGDVKVVAEGCRRQLAPSVDMLPATIN